MRTDHSQRLAIPAYFYPYPDQTYWSQLRKAAPAVGLSIADPDNGPGRQIDPRYVSEIASARDRGIQMLGYVTTSYGGRSIREVQADIKRWCAWYAVDGIFFDEVSNSPNGLSCCKTLYTYTKKLMGPSHLIVLNPGVQTPESFMDVCDILLNNESNWRTYRDAYIGNASWVAKYPASRFWHLVYDCPSEAEMRHAIQLARERHAAWVYVTPGTGSNPYEILPTGRYWRSQLRFTAQYAE